MKKNLLLTIIFATATYSAAFAEEARRAPVANPNANPVAYDSQRWADQPGATVPAPIVQAQPVTENRRPANNPEVKTVAAPVAPQQVSVEGRTPLVVVRFTKPAVSYEEQLYNAVEEAIKVSPNVVFDVVGFPPISGNKKGVVNSRASEVVSSLYKIGVPHSRITLQTKPSRAGYEEVMVYVR